MATSSKKPFCLIEQQELFELIEEKESTQADKKKRIEYMGYGISVVDILTLGNIFYIIVKDFKKNRSTELQLTSMN